MRNLLIFLNRFKIFIVFVALQSIALGIYFSYTYYPGMRFLSSTQTINNSLITFRNGITDHFSLAEKNDSLLAENAYLRNRLKENYVRVQTDLVKISDTLHRQNYTYISSNIINSTINHRNNFVTLDIGKKHGVEEGMGVVSKNGLVGIVFKVSDNYTLVRSILSENINISIKLKKNNEHGLLKWNGRDYKEGLFTGLTNDLEVNPGDTVVTRGSHTHFPRNYPVGVVASAEYEEGQPHQKVIIQFFNDLNTLQYAYIINNLTKQEQLKLEKIIKEENND
ncbi:MAG: rod shape-determining protein MreC [Crocinitomicaceae bacterium]|nr:rod shape-determining protein MreC [Crocinitomicaceae bacterium]